MVKSRRIQTLLLTAAAMLALLPLACDKNTDDSVGPGLPPPIVMSTSPADGDSNVVRDAVVTAYFSKDMDPATIKSTTFLVDGNTQGTIGYDSASRTASFTPTASLAYNNTYNARITTGVRDIAGVPMPADYRWSFTTDPGIIMPLAAGNRWIFEVTEYAISGTITDTYFDTIEIVRDTAIGGETWYADADDTLYVNRADGLWKRRPDGSGFLFIKYPTFVGDVYFSNSPLQETVTVASTGTLVTTIIGNFVCHQYIAQGANPSDLHHIYFAPNRGPIVIERHFGLVSGVSRRARLIGALVPSPLH